MASSFDRDDVVGHAVTFDKMAAGCYDPKARLEAMDANHTEASLCFPTFPRFCGQTFLEAKDVMGAYGHLFAQISARAIEPLGAKQAAMAAFVHQRKSAQRE